MEELKRLSEQAQLIPLKPNSKAPRDSGYANRDYTLEDLDGGNVGMMIAEDFVDIDLDWPEARKLVQYVLRDFGVSFGWGRKDEFTHLVYRAKLDQGIDFQLPDVTGAPKLNGAHGRMILQLRTSAGGEPYHAMIPPSTHPDGDTLEWNFDTSTGEKYLTVMEADGASLVESCAYVAGLSALARFYPSQGNRDEAMLGIVGCMVRAGYDQDGIESFVRDFCHLVGDNEVQMRVDKAKRTLKRQATGIRFRGIPNTAKQLGIPIEWMQEIAVWLGWKKRNPKGKGAAVFLSAQVAEVSKQAWDALAEYEVDDDPGVYAYGEALSRVDNGRMQLLDASGLKFELNRCATWLLKDDEKFKPVSAPSNVVDDMLSARRRD